MPAFQPATVPAIRFRGFDKKWQEYEIGEVLSETTRPIVLEDDRRYELVTVKRRNGGVVSRGHLYGREILVKNYSQLATGDFLISKRQVVHGATGTVPATLDKAIVSNEYLVAVENANLSNDFLTLVCKRPQMRRKFFLSSYGVVIEKLFFDVEDWKRRGITLPKRSEQAKVCSYFETLDRTIALCQRRHDKLVTLKQAMLLSLFPRDGDNVPKVRFKGFSGAWAPKPIGEIFAYERPDGYIVKSSVYSDLWATPVLTANKAFVLGYTDEKRTFRKPCVIFDDFTLDCKYVDFPFMVKSSALKILTIRNQETDDLYFGFHSLKCSRIEVMGHARHYIGVVQSTPVLTPEIDEQRKIAAYFHKIDQLISQHATQLEKLKHIKTACLERMFV